MSSKQCDVRRAGRRRTTWPMGVLLCFTVSAYAQNPLGVVLSVPETAVLAIQERNDNRFSADNDLSVNQLHLNRQDQIATLSLAKLNQWTGDAIAIDLPPLWFDRIRAINGTPIKVESRTGAGVVVSVKPSSMGRYVPPNQGLPPTAFYMVPRGSWSAFSSSNSSKARLTPIHRPIITQQMVLTMADGGSAFNLDLFPGGIDLRGYNTGVASDPNFNGGGGELPLGGEFDCQPPAGNEADITLTTANPNQLSRGWYLDPVYVGDGFVSTFRFQMTNAGATRGGIERGGDGFAFVVQKAFQPLDESKFRPPTGGYLGYHNLPSSVAVEFDTYQNPEFYDPNGNHISIHSLGANPNTISDHPGFRWPTATSGIPLLNDGREHFVEIRYEPPTLSVFLDDLASPLLQFQVRITGHAWLGFTASTGSSFQQHDIFDWDIRAFGVGPG